MKFNNVVESVWESDAERQREILPMLASEIRHSPGLEKVFEANKMFFVDSHDFLPNLVGDYITDPSLDIYTREGDCKELGKLWIPLYDLNDDVVAFAFWDCGLIPSKSKHPIKYRMQRQGVAWNKYMNIRRDTFLSGLSSGVIFVNDGFMDKFHLEMYGMPASSLYGSNLSTLRKVYLSAFKHVILCRDNDNAGEMLEEKFLDELPNSIILKHGMGKDMDDYLKSSPIAHKHVIEFYELVRKGGFSLRKHTLPDLD